MCGEKKKRKNERPKEKGRFILHSVKLTYDFKSIKNYSPPININIARCQYVD